MSRMMRQLRGRPELLSIPLVSEAADRIEQLERRLAEPSTYWAELMDPNWRRLAIVTVRLKGRLPAVIRWEGRYYHYHSSDVTNVLPRRVVRYIECRPGSYLEPRAEDIAVVSQGSGPTRVEERKP